MSQGGGHTTTTHSHTAHSHAATAAEATDTATEAAATATEATDTDTEATDTARHSQTQPRTFVVATALCDLGFRCLLSGLHIIPQVQLAPPLLHLAIPRALAACHRLRWGHRVCVEA